MEHPDVAEDLRVIRKVLEMTHRRVDPQMFHAIIWGAIVLVWFPAMNYLELKGLRRGQLYAGIAAVGVGTLTSTILGFLAGRVPRLTASNTRLAAQCGAAVACFVISGMLLSFAIPTLVPGGERFIPHLWGLLYSLLLMMLGVFYSREFFFCGLLVFAATVAALAWAAWSGFILGGAIGIGCIVPGVIAERRVSRMRRERLDEELGAV